VSPLTTDTWYGACIIQVVELMIEPVIIILNKLVNE